MQVCLAPKTASPGKCPLAEGRGKAYQIPEALHLVIGCWRAQDFRIIRSKPLTLKVWKGRAREREDRTCIRQ